MSATSPFAATVLRFESFELNLRSGELRKRGVRLRLQGQPLRLLEILLKSAGELVTREELRAQLWPADTFVDYDNSIHNAVGRIREVLGDSADTPKYIETLPRRGYRFIAPLEEVQAARARVEAPMPETVLAQVPAMGNVTENRNLAFAGRALTRRGVQRTASVLILSTCSVVALAASLSWQRVHAQRPVTSVRSIAVLPMGNFSDDAAQEHFADGMTEELISELSRIEGLKVISRTSVMGYKGTKKRLPQIALELGVDGIVEGSVSREGDQVRINVQLLDGPNDRHLWSEDYQRELGGALNLQREIAQVIAEQIRARVEPVP